jgi:hypothetical protein
VGCTGYRHDLGWIEAPVLDASGSPVQVLAEHIVA